LTADSSCPICDGRLEATGVQALDRLVTGEGPFTIIECERCGYGVSMPSLDEKALSRFYPDEYYEDFYEHSQRGAGNVLRRLRARYRRRSADRRFRRPPFGGNDAKTGRVLDVGCGSGDLLAHFAGSGWETHGIDPSRNAADSAARRGADVHHGTLHDQPWPADHFQLITFQHSLEHIVDPVDALERACALLAPGAMMILEVPNWMCWQRRWLFRDRWFGLDLPRHRQHLSTTALARLATKLEMEIEVVGTNSTAISTAYSLHYVLFGHWSPGWKLWLTYALSLPMLPFILLGDRIWGGDCCHIVMRRTERG
jgi:2-polyprenyl-3-methyl-5-hydroxy-6-metoxy-1,4-benzoquinol methylase